MKRLTDHWELKVISLVLAIAIYFFTGTITTTSTRVTVDVDTLDVRNAIERSLPPGYQVREISPDSVELTLSGPLGVIADIEGPSLRPQLAFSAANLGSLTQTYDLTAGLLALDPTVALSDATAEVIDVTVDQIVDVTRPIDPDLSIEGLPDGLAVVGITYALDQVQVSGPRRLLERLARVPVHGVDLATSDQDLVGEATLTVPLVPDLPELISVLQRQQLSAEIRLSPEIGERTVGPLPVRILASPEFHRDYVVELSSDVVPLTVRGPLHRLERLEVDSQIQVFVDMDQSPTTGASESRPLRVVAPAWASVGSDQIRVTVRERVAADPPILPPDTSGPLGEGELVLPEAPVAP